MGKSAVQRLQYSITIRCSENMFDRLKEQTKKLQQTLPGTTITMGQVIRMNLIKGMDRNDD